VADDLSAIVAAIGADEFDSATVGGYVPTAVDLPFVEY
jgi:hypothetical protein